MAGDDRIDEAVGSVAEEAARLIETLRRQASGAERADEPLAPGDDHEHRHEHVPMGEAAACTYCPVCRGVVLLRSVSPETLDRLADVATSVAALLADLAASRSAAGAPAPSRRARAEKIDVVDEED